MDSGNVLQQITGITDQSLEEAQARLPVPSSPPAPEDATGEASLPVSDVKQEGSLETLELVEAELKLEDEDRKGSPRKSQ